MFALGYLEFKFVVGFNNFPSEFGTTARHSATELLAEVDTAAITHNLIKLKDLTKLGGLNASRKCGPVVDMIVDFM